ncbi:MAG: hypothetical protein ACRCY4_02570 [Brevinema sp.]
MEDTSIKNANICTFLQEQSEDFTISDIPKMKDYLSANFSDFLPYLYNLNSTNHFSLRRELWTNASLKQRQGILPLLIEINNKKPKDRIIDPFNQGEFFPRYYQDYLCAILSDLYFTNKDFEREIIQFTLDVSKKMDVASESAAFTIFLWKNFISKSIELTTGQIEELYGKYLYQPNEESKGLSPEFGIFFIFQILLKSLKNPSFEIPPAVQKLFSNVIDSYMERKKNEYINPYGNPSQIEFMVWKDIFDEISYLQETEKVWIWDLIKELVDRNRLQQQLQKIDYSDKDTLLDNIFKNRITIEKIEGLREELYKMYGDCSIPTQLGNIAKSNIETSKFGYLYDKVTNLINEGKLNNKTIEREFTSELKDFIVQVREILIELTTYPLFSGDIKTAITNMDRKLETFKKILAEGNSLKDILVDNNVYELEKNRFAIPEYNKLSDLLEEFISSQK